MAFIHLPEVLLFLIASFLEAERDIGIVSSNLPKMLFSPQCLPLSAQFVEPRKFRSAMGGPRGNGGNNSYQYSKWS